MCLLAPSLLRVALRFTNQKVLPLLIYLSITQNAGHLDCQLENIILSDICKHILINFWLRHEIMFVCCFRCSRNAFRSLYVVANRFVNMNVPTHISYVIGEGVASNYLKNSGIAVAANIRLWRALEKVRLQLNDTRFASEWVLDGQNDFKLF